MKNMLESQFPGINVVLANYPPPLPKRLLSKAVPVLQFGVIGIIMGGEHIFPRLGFAAPPQWYYSMRANRFGSMASTWLLGNFLQSFLQSSGAFEVYCNGELVMFLLSFISSRLLVCYRLVVCVDKYSTSTCFTGSICFEKYYYCSFASSD